MATIIREIEEEEIDPALLQAMLDEQAAAEEEEAEQADVELSPNDEEFVDNLIMTCILFIEDLCDTKFYPYQREVAYRIIESVVLGDGEEITVLQARQSGKTETLANVLAGLMILLPRLAKAYPDLLGKYAKGFWVGTFAPTEEQADTVWGRIVDRLSSERAIEYLLDPEIEDKVTKEGGKSKCIRLKNSGSLCRRQTCNPKAKIESKSYHFVLVDECFPAETPVLTTEGWVAIGDIVNGERRDWVVATQEADGSLGWGRVTTGYRTPRHTPLVRVDHEHGSVYATANHPFMVDGHHVPAISLTPGTVLSVVPGAPQPGRRVGEEGADVVLLQHLPSALAQSDERPSGALAHGIDASGDWAPPQGAGRQWSGDDRATAEALGRSWGRLGGRACVPHWRETQGRSAVALQDRPGASPMEVGRGAGWGVARNAGSPGTGSAEDGVAHRSRVVRVEVLEPGSPEFDQFGDGADYVYTLEVDSESHTYVAGGVLVGNCQEADSFVVTKSIGPMLAFYNGTRVYTGTPTREKNIFYKAIQLNKRRQTKRGVRQNHFEYNYKFVCKYNANYRKFIAKEKVRLGEDSDEFQMSYNCVTPETLVLTSDLRWVPAGSLRVGDRIIGFDEERPGKGLHRQFRDSTVTVAKRIMRPSYKVTLEDGTEVTSSFGHMWLVSTAGRRTVWKTTEELTTTDRIFKVSDVWRHERDYTTGYLAAAFEGEGHFTNVRSGQLSVGFTQRDNVMLEQVRKHLADRGFSTWERQQDNGVTDIHIGGGRAEVLRFLGEVRPERLIERFRPSMLGSIGRHDRRSGGFDHPRVVAKEFVGEIEVVALETTTKTFIAEGLASHNCKWLLDQGMFITEEKFDLLGDSRMRLYKSWFKSKVVVGIDPARTKDSTVVTVVWVDWDRPDPFGFYEHRILNWLEITNKEWEKQYYEIYEFLSHYNILRIGVDSTGMGSAVYDRIRVLFPDVEVIECPSDAKTQAERWKHLTAIVEREALVYPAHSTVKRLRPFKRFRQQMIDLETKMRGPYLLAQAPDENEAHDDYPDSLAIACSMTLMDTLQEAEAVDSPFVGRRR